MWRFFWIQSVFCSVSSICAHKRNGPVTFLAFVTPVTYQIALLAASPPFPSLLATCATKELFPAGQDSLVTRPPGADDLRLAGRVLTPDMDIRLLNFYFSTCSWASLLTSQCFCVPVFEGGCVPHWTQARRPELWQCYVSFSVTLQPIFFEAGSL